MWAHHRTCWLNNVTPRHRSLGYKIGPGLHRVNGHTLEVTVPMLGTLLIALASLIAWGVLTFGFAPQPGVVHLLLALGTTLLVRWWALRA
jgi:hypothetical protein